jgi:hypothetical protein
LFFIVGVPRSGTTLLAAMLAAHPRLAVTPETHYLDHFRPLADRHRAFAAPDRTARFIDYLLTSACIKDFHFTAEETAALRADLLRLSPPQHAGGLALLLNHYAKKIHAQRSAPLLALGEKTPGHFQFIPHLLDWFPHARILHLIRDVRDVALSAAQTPWYTGGLLHQINLWKQAATLADREPRLTERNLLTIRYEDLLADPRAALARACAFLNVPFDEAMLHHHEQSAATFDPQREPWKQNAAQPLDAGNVEKWRAAMAPAHRRLVCRRLASQLTRHGYPVEPAPFHRSDLIALAALHLHRALRFLPHALTRLRRRLCSPF